jgi:hypothetical protein
MKNKPIIHNSLFLILFLVAVLSRTIFHLGPNIELVTTVMILSSYYLGRKSSFWLVFLIMAVTDRIIGNTSIFLFTWSGFLIPSLFASKLFKNLKLEIKNLPIKTLGLVGGGLLSNVFFFIWTNLGVWLLDSWGMYPKTFAGLIMSYINGLPFLKPQLASTLIFVPLGFTLIEISILIYKNYLKKFRFIANKSSSF